MMNNTYTKSLLVAGAFFAAAGAVYAQDSAPLVDLLVRKGIVTDQEAEELKAELINDFVNTTAAGKLNLSSSITEFKLSGDVRLRRQEEVKQSQGKTTSDERSRNRFRFRFNGDIKLKAGWGAGFALETGSAADSGNQTFESANDDYGIYLARAYVSYDFNKQLTVYGGKFKNPFYTTDLVWDSDINPQGFGEVYNTSFGNTALTINAAQIAMSDVKETSSGASGRDSYLFVQQAVFTSKVGGAKLVVAPGFMFSTNSNIGASGNETSWSGNTGNYDVLTMPGELGFSNVAGEGTSLKFYWDLAHNFSADDLVHKTYGLAETVDEDGTAWLVGVGYAFGKGKEQGDYSIKLDYREIGVGSLNPNISDSDFAFGNMNQKGFKVSASYNVTSFASLNAAYFYTTDKQETLSTTVAGLDHSQILQLDLVVKF